MEAEVWSETDRRDGTRGIFDPSMAGLVAGDSSSESAVAGPEAKSIESSGALGGASFEGVAMDEDIQVLSAGHEETDRLGDFETLCRA
jgi:hypothetical protein